MDWTRRLTPRASRRTRLLLAAATWSVVGAGLLIAGLGRVLPGASTWTIVAIVAAVGVGWAKGHFVLARRAEKNARRIAATGAQRCLGGAFSAGMWALAVGMMAMGFVLRRWSGLPPLWLGLLYTAVGVALASASLVAWSHWRRMGRGASGPGAATQPITAEADAP